MKKSGERNGKISEETMMIKIKGIKEILTSMGMLFVVLDASGNIIEINKTTSEIIGYPQTELIGKNWFDTAIPEDEKERVSFIHKRVLKGNELKFEEAENDIVSLRFKRKTVHWWNLLICKEDGAVFRIVSFGMDVTENRVSEQIFRILAERKPLETLKDILPILKKFLYFDIVLLGVSTSDESFRIITQYVSPEAMGSLAGLFRELNEGEDPSEGEFKMNRLIKSVLAEGKSEYVPETADGRFEEDKIIARHGWHSRLIVPLVSTSKMKMFLAFASKKARSLGVNDLRFIRKIKPSVAAAAETWYFEEEMNRLASIDLLTEVFNRHSLLQILNHEMARSSRGNRNFSVAMLDLDRFKHFNDTYGHDAGDAVLKNFAQTVKSNLREYDVFGRYGGDEFVLIFPNTDGKTASGVVSRLVNIISSSRIFPEEKVEFSAGVAELKAGDTEETLIKRADNALYAAKRSYGEKVVF